MGIRTIRLDPGSERLLAKLVRQTGMNVSQTLKAGLAALHQAHQAQAGTYPYEVYRTLDLGPGGYARAPARQAKRAVRDLLRRKAR